MVFYESFELGSYEPFGQWIKFNLLEREEYDKFLIDGLTVANFEKFKIYFHELRHYFDHIGTLWGQNYLAEIYLRLNDILDSKEFDLSMTNPIVELKRLEDGGLIQKYLSLQETRNSGIWKMNYKFEFIDRIPFFVVEFDKQTGAKICKTAVTFHSLFETNATFEEISLFIYLSKVRKAYKTDSEKIEEIRIQREYFQKAYNSELIEYSVVTHLVAQILKEPNSLQAYGISALLSSVILNLTKLQLKKISENSSFLKYSKFHHILVANKDLGYLFYIHCKNYVENRTEEKFNFEEFLETNGLPESSNIEALIIDEMEQNKKYLKKSHKFHKRFIDDIDNGILKMNYTGIGGKKMSLYEFDKMNLIKPELIFRNDFWEENSIEAIVNSKSDDLKFEDWYTLIQYLGDKIKLKTTENKL